MGKSARHVLLQFAMHGEADPLIAAIGAKRLSEIEAKPFPFQFFGAERGGLRITIAIAGKDPFHAVDSIGSVPAAVLASTSLRLFQPDLVITAGTCGGFLREKHEIAQVLVGVKHAVFHDRRNVIPGMHEYGIGKFPVAKSERLRESLGLASGIVSSGDALDYSEDDRKYFALNGGTLKEMEAAAIGWVCALARIPLLPIKTITDWVDHPACTGEQFHANYAQATAALGRELVRALDYLAARPDDEVWRST